VAEPLGFSSSGPAGLDRAIDDLGHLQVRIDLRGRGRLAFALGSAIQEASGVAGAPFKVSLEPLLPSPRPGKAEAA
jgi:hypothetical protein